MCYCPFDTLVYPSSDAPNQCLPTALRHRPASVPEDFTELLEQRRPEAIAIMGYWALYLHCSKDVWHVGDSGAHLLRSIAQYLGPAWNHWLSWPLAMLAST